MRPTIAVLVYLLAFVATAIAQPNASSERVISGPVQKVLDGDGIVIDGIKIRLIGIDAFENRRPRGPEAKAFLKSFVKGKVFRCVIQGIDIKDGERPYAQCTDEAGKDLSCAVAWQGFAVEWRKYSKGKYAPCDRITTMQESALPGPAPF